MKMLNRSRLRYNNLLAINNCRISMISALCESQNCFKEPRANKLASRDRMRSKTIDRQARIRTGLYTDLSRHEDNVRNGNIFSSSCRLSYKRVTGGRMRITCSSLFTDFVQVTLTHAGEIAQRCTCSKSAF